MWLSSEGADFCPRQSHIACHAHKALLKAAAPCQGTTGQFGWLVSLFADPPGNAAAVWKASRNPSPFRCELSLWVLPSKEAMWLNGRFSPRSLVRGAVNTSGLQVQPCDADQHSPHPSETGPNLLPRPVPSLGTRAAPGEDPDKPSPSRGLVTILHPPGTYHSSLKNFYSHSHLIITGMDNFFFPFIYIFS